MALIEKGNPENIIIQACGFQHEQTWSLQYSTLSGQLKTNFARILSCPFISGGNNLLCAHPHNVNRDSNVRIRLLEDIKKLPSQKRIDELTSQLQNIFSLIERLDQLARFSYTGGFVTEIIKLLQSAPWNVRLLEIISLLECIIEKNQLNLITLKDMLRKRSTQPLGIVDRKEFQGLLFEAQAILAGEIQGVLEEVYS